MRVTIITEGAFVSINGEGYYGVDVSSISPDIHAVQWYETVGDVERKDGRGRIVSNEEIADLTPYQSVLDAWQVAKVAAAQAEVDRQAAEVVELTARKAEAERLALEGLEAERLAFEALAQQAAEQPPVEQS